MISSGAAQFVCIRLSCRTQKVFWQKLCYLVSDSFSKWHVVLSQVQKASACNKGDCFVDVLSAPCHSLEKIFPTRGEAREFDLKWRQSSAYVHVRDEKDRLCTLKWTRATVYTEVNTSDRVHWIEHDRLRVLSRTRSTACTELNTIDCVHWIEHDRLFALHVPLHILSWTRSTVYTELDMIDYDWIYVMTTKECTLRASRTIDCVQSAVESIDCMRWPR